MDAAIAERAEVGSRPRFQASVWGLTVCVLAAAIYFALVRGAQGFWIKWGGPTTPPLLDVDRVLGVALLLPAVLLAILLLFDAYRGARSTPGAEIPGRGAFAVAWRVLAVIFLAGMALKESSLLDVDRYAVRLGLDRSSWQVKLCTLGMGLGMIGVLLAASPYRERARRAEPRRRWAWLSVVLAGLLGVILIAFGPDALIPYLVILALEAVSNAIRRPGLFYGQLVNGEPVAPILVDRSLWRPLHDRFLAAGAEAALALLLCMLTACWLVRDLRASSSDRETRRSWRGLCYRGITALATWGAGAFLLFHTLPQLHPMLAEGFWDLLHPELTRVIVASFLAFSAGLAARGVAAPHRLVDAASVVPPPRPPILPARVAAWVIKLAAAVVLVMIILTAIDRLRNDDAPSPWYVPLPLAAWLDLLSKPLTIATKGATYLDPSVTPDALVAIGGAAWIVLLSIRYVLGRRGSRGDAPLDRIGNDRRLLGRFLGTWFALSGVMLALLPAFFLAGMAVLHLSLRATNP